MSMQQHEDEYHICGDPPYAGNDEQELPPVLPLPKLPISRVLRRKLWIGSMEGAKDLVLLTSKNIHAVINMTKAYPNIFEDRDDFVYLKCPVNDLPGENISRYFERTYKFIGSYDTYALHCWLTQHSVEKSPYPVLVHCVQGISRSATIGMPRTLN